MTKTSSNSLPPPDNEARKAFEALVHEHQSRIRRFVRSMGAPSSAVDDITQEALLLAYQRFSEYQEGTSFVAWICAIARNMIRAGRRKEGRRLEIINGAFTEYMEAQAISDELDDSDEDYHQRVALKECMQQVPEESRQLIDTRYEQGMGPTAMAEFLGLTPESVRMRLMRIRQALKKCISKKLANWANN